jgi:hypothetical protein
MPDPTGHTAMTLAARLGRLSFIRALLSRGADPNGAMLRQGCVATNVIFFFLQGGGGSLRNSCWIDFAYRHLIYLLCSRFSIWIFANKKKKKKKTQGRERGVTEHPSAPFRVRERMGQLRAHAAGTRRARSGAIRLCV